MLFVSGRFATVLLTTVVMVAFAGNSLLCRVALREGKIDAANFTSIRLISGAVVLWLLMTARAQRLKGDWNSAAALFTYAAAFSFAYLSLPAGTGALLLFAAVQFTMMSTAVARGERLGMRQLAGAFISFAGLVILFLPGIAVPPLKGAILMLAAGAAWGLYSLRGKGVADPAAATAGNFIRATPAAVILSAVMLSNTHITAMGAAYATISGAITSGLGYVLWYSVLPHLKATTAATVQLSAPVIAAAGGVLLLGEPMTARLAVATAAVLGGIGLAVTKRKAAQPATGRG